MSYMTEERKMIQQTARDFSVNEVLPVANKLDPVEGEIPMELRDKMAGLGYFGILIPEEFGGLGLGAFEYALITEELARGWMSVASIIARGNGMGTQARDPERRAELLRRSAAGEWIGAAALSEAGAGSDLANVQCRGVRDGDEYVISGEKRWCGNALAADFIMLLVRTSDPGEGENRSRGLESMLIEKERDRF